MSSPPHCLHISSPAVGRSRRWQSLGLGRAGPLLTCLSAASPRHRVSTAFPGRLEGAGFPQHRNCKDAREAMVCPGNPGIPV